MDMSIHKFTLPIEDSVTILLPSGAQVLSVGAQPSIRGILQLWAVVPVGEGVTTTPRRFHVRGTGHPVNGILGETPIDVYAKFIDTVIDAPFVWHVFETRIGH